MPDSDKGLYDKYLIVKKVDGTVITDCFILRPDKDPAAVVALQAYAAVTPNKALADDLYKWVGRPLNKPLTLKEVNQHQDPVWIEFRCFDMANGWRDGIYAALFWVTRVYKGLETVPRYGVHFRLWLCKPSDEERAAAPWEV